MKKILLVLISAMLVACSFAGVFAANAETTSNAEAGVEDLDITFNASGFLTHLDKMLIGMIGIFIVVGVVILITYILNRIMK